MENEQSGFDPQQPIQDQYLDPSGYEHEQQDDTQAQEPSVEELRAQWAERESQLQRERDEAARLATEREQQLAQYNADIVRQRQEAWERSKQEAIQHARSLSFDEGQAYLAQFYENRERQLFEWGQSLYQQQEQERMRTQARTVAKEYGLPDEDAETLYRAAAYAGDPRVITTEAQRLKQRNELSSKELRETRERLDRLEKELSRGQLIRSGAQRFGSGSGRQVPANVTPGSDDHLRALIGDILPV